MRQSLRSLALPVIQISKRIATHPVGLCSLFGTRHLSEPFASGYLNFQPCVDASACWGTCVFVCTGFYACVLCIMCGVVVSGVDLCCWHLSLTAVITDRFLLLSFVEKNKVCLVHLTRRSQSSPDLNKRVDKLSFSELKVTLHRPGTSPSSSLSFCFISSRRSHFI